MDTTTRTFRLQENTVKKLEEIADQEKINANQLVNNLLDDFTNWGHKAKAIGFINFPKSLLEQIYNSLTDEKINEIAINHAKENIADIITFLEKQYTEESFLNALEKWSSSNKIPFQKIRESNLKYIFNLGMGINFSNFFIRYVKVVVESFGNNKIESTINGDTVKFTLIPINSDI